MASRAGLVENLRRQREDREAQRRQQVDSEKAALLIQRVFRGRTARWRWLDSEWRQLHKQVHDLELLAEKVRQKGQQFVAPCKVLLPLLCRAAWHGAGRAAAECAELLGRLALFALGCLLAPLSDQLRSLCGSFQAENQAAAAAAAPPPHVPGAAGIVLRFIHVLLMAVTRAQGAAGSAEAAQVMNAQAWGEGKAMEDSEACRRLASFLLLSTLRQPVPGQRIHGAAAGQLLHLWCIAITAALASWPAGGSAASPRLLGLVGIAAAWLQLASAAGPGEQLAVAELVEGVLGIPRIGALLAQAPAPCSSAPICWAPLLKSFALRLGGGGAAPLAQEGSLKSKAFDREFGLVYAAGNLWELHSRGTLPLEPLLAVQALLTERLEISMLPGAAAPVDERLAEAGLRRQLRPLVEPVEVAKLFSRVLHLQSQGPLRSGMAHVHASAYQQHCLAVVLNEVKPSAVEALCRTFSALLLRARAATRAAKSEWSFQVYNSIVNSIAYMEGGDVARVLWRFALAFYEWHSPGRGMTDFHHLLFLHATIVLQLLTVMSPDELGGARSPFRNRDLAEYVKHSTHLAARLAWEGAAPAQGAASSPGASTTPTAVSEALLEQLRRVLGLLHTLIGRLPEGACLPTQVWHAPCEFVRDFPPSAPQLAGGESQPRIPKLSPAAERILRFLPQGVPFEQRVAILRARICEVQEHWRSRPVVKVIIRRTHIFEDGLANLANVDWCSRIQVAFMSEGGRMEQGQDAGGLFKEFWEKLAETAFNPEYGLFRATESGLLYPNPEAAQYHQRTDVLFKFLGAVIGKAIFEGIVVEPCFAPFFLSKLLGRHNSYYDLQSLDPALFANLQRLKGYEGNIADLCCSFVANTASGKEVPLVPDGENTPVTAENRFRYVYLLSDYKLNIELKAGSTAFLLGFKQLIDERWLHMFGEDELQQVISGTKGSNLDVEDLQRHTQYSNCHSRDRLVTDFFHAVKAMQAKQRVQLLRFVTSCSRTPLLGFGHLVPPFTVHKVQVRSDSEKLPTASTCFNTLKLPTYSSWRVMKQKLEFVIAQGAGFELD